jgi:hypothetical protein
MLEEPELVAEAAVAEAVLAVLVEMLYREVVMELVGMEDSVFKCWSLVRHQILPLDILVLVVDRGGLQVVVEVALLIHQTLKMLVEKVVDLVDHMQVVETELVVMVTKDKVLVEQDLVEEAAEEELLMLVMDKVGLESSQFATRLQHLIQTLQKQLVVLLVLMVVKQFIPSLVLEHL